MRSSLAEKVCVSILPRSIGELRQLCESALELGAKLIELRLDGLQELEMGEAAKISNDMGFRRIITLRPSWEGGLYAGDEQKRLELLSSVSTGVECVDLEFKTIESNPRLVEELKSLGVKVISSRHYFNEAPSSLELRRIVAKGLESADIVKVVNNPRRVSEAMDVLALYSEASFRGRVVAFSMGERWCLTRVLSILLGSPFTYASLPGQPVAPGQPSFSEALEALEVFLTSWPSWQL
ncbi:3-dehydroquinate dehydratase [Candidatus Calditenuaceae archaeon HR02]|nr:3-dehydroquinate dehydratase [Candidatus Calditenuaceae archaeon HR02]